MFRRHLHFLFSALTLTFLLREVYVGFFIFLTSSAGTECLSDFFRRKYLEVKTIALRIEQRVLYACVWVRRCNACLRFESGDDSTHTQNTMEKESRKLYERIFLIEYEFCCFCFCFCCCCVFVSFSILRLWLKGILGISRIFIERDQDIKAKEQKRMWPEKFTKWRNGTADFVFVWWCVLAYICT